LHVASIIAVLIVPSAWQWVLAIVIANHLVLISATLFTRSQILGTEYGAAAYRRHQAE
jgi:hypothetical protein